jgi:hypothetical protein
MLIDRLDKYLDGIDQARRDVINDLVIGSAYVPPAVVGFNMSSSPTGAGDLGPFAPNT